MEIKISNTETPNIIGISFRSIDFRIVSGVRIAANPTTIPILAILLPIIFPKIIAL